METDLSSLAPPCLPPAKKTSVKRCLSPGSDLEEGGEAGAGCLPAGAKRKTTDPKLLLVQSEALSLTDLTSQYRRIVSQSRRDSETTPTYDPSSVPSSSLPSLPSSSISTFPSSSCSAVTAHSTSYTSWTKPVKGRRDSDSCGPNSSILDIFTEQEQELDVGGAGVSVRESSADTSKDVSDIESDWDEEIGGMEFSSDHKVKTNKNSINNSKRSIFLQHKKIKKFSL